MSRTTLLRIGRVAGACLLLALAQCSLGGGGYFGAPGRGGDPFKMLAKMAQQKQPARPPAGDAPRTNEQILARQRATQEQALAEAEKSHGPNHPAVASNLAQLGGIDRQLGRYAEAEAMLKRALVIQERTTADPEMAATLDELARVYAAQGRYGEAEPLLKRSVAIYEEALGPDGAHVRADLSEASAAAGLMSAADLSLPNPDVVMMPSALSSLGEIYAAEGRYDDAERVFKRAAALTDKLFPDLGDAASYGSLFSLASIYSAQGRDAEAEALLKRTLAVQQQWSKQWSAQVEKMMGNLAQEMCESQDMSMGAMSPAAFQSGFMPCDIDGQPNRGWFKQLQEQAAAWQLTDATLEQTMAASQDVFRAGVLDALAQVYARERRDGEAAPLYDEAVALREKALGPAHPDLATALAHRAALYVQEQRPAEAIRDARRSSEILRDRAGRAGEQRSRGALSERRIYRKFFLTHVAAAEALARSPEQRLALTAEAFEAGQLAQVSATAQALTGMAARFAGGSDALAALVREQQDTFNRWQVLDAELVKASSKPPKSRNSQEDAARLQELAALDRRLKELGERLVREFPRYAEIVSPRPVPLADAQRLLRPDEALLVWSVGDEVSFLWAVRQDRAMVARLPIGAKALDAAVRRLRDALDPSIGIQGGRWPRFDTQAAYALYQQILAPAEPVIAGARHLLVIPDGALQSLPLGVLVTQAPARPIAEYRDYRQVPWLMRRYAMSVLPSVSALPALRGLAAPAQAKQPFVGIGDPVLEGEKRQARAVSVAGLFRGANVDVALLRQLPPLPEAAEELRAEARLLGAGDGDLYLRERATVPRVMQANLRDYRVVAFATHAAVGGELEGLAEPALVLTPPVQASEQDDGLLTASRVAQLQLDADWVVLSACNTAAGDGTPGAEGLSGLAKAFFYAGTRAVLVSHWPVFSKSAVKLTTTAFEAMAKEPRLGRAGALQKAMLSMVDSDNEPLLGHPMLWAPFVVVGEGGSGR